MLVESPHSAKIKIPLPDATELREFVGYVTADEPDFDELCELSRDALADRLVGLSRVNVRRLLRRALRNARGSISATSPTCERS